ncbi:MAG: hypothetical protein M5U33_04405 [Pseudorhodoplanes sp.]|nr:hypothetical protein [Pseudorhodoplanes sp.]
MLPVSPTLKAELRAVAVRLLAYLCGITCLAIVTAELFKSNPVVAAAEPVERPEWITVERPYPAFEVNLPEFGEGPHYTIRRHELGGGRKDILTFGEPGRSVRYIAIEIYRPGGEQAHFEDPVRALVARAEALEPSGDIRASFPIETKYGQVTTADFAFGRFGGGHCVGFVRTSHAPRLQISGVSCNMGALVDRSSVACLLDRLTLLSAGSDRATAGFFARAEVNRKFCGQRDPLMYATPRHQSPAEHAPTVRLRGALASR